MSVVAIIGRPNVGKSSLFNRIIGKREAVVAREPGTTRDRVYGSAAWRGKRFQIVDTGGLGGTSVFEKDIMAQAELAINEADVILFMMDGQAGPLPDDRKILSKIQKADKKFVIAANKIDSQKAEDILVEFRAKGIDPVPISTIHGRGVGDLLNEVVKKLPKTKDRPKGSPRTVLKEFTVSILGRVNAGKSTLFNALLGGARAITSEVPGTTIDTFSADLDFDGKSITLYDSAGLRKNPKTRVGLEYFGSLRALEALEKSDAVILCVDGEAGPTHLDKQIAQFTKDSGAGLVIAVNKYDLFRDDETDMIASVRSHFAFVNHALVVLVSAKTGINLDALKLAVTKILKNIGTRVEHKELVKLLHETDEPGIKYIAQLKSRPQVFALFMRPNAVLPKSKVRFFERLIRERFGFDGIPVKIEVKESNETRNRSRKSRP